DNRMRYRLIDSPLTRTLIGLGLFLQGQQPIPTDWDWSKSWTENKLAGSLPSPDVLLAARWSVAWLFPLSCIFLFLITKKIGGSGSAVIALILFSSNALILLHTRRAMAEGALICFLCASVWALMTINKRAWLAAIPIGLSINAKQTTFPLAGIGLFHVLFQPDILERKRSRILQTVFFLFVVLTISWILNPVFWKSPAEALDTGIAFRNDLSGRMEVDYHSSSNFLDQTAKLIGQVFIQPPAIADVQNYRDKTKIQQENYLRQPLNNLFRGLWTGAFFLGLTIFGWLILVRRVFSHQPTTRYPMIMFLIITMITMLVIILYTPVSFQRYYVILIPLFIVAQSVALNALGLAINHYYKEKRATRFGQPSQN
ncbi:MAG TPA: hypothetical protein VF338_07105, partial [Leptolinea sp.]